MSASRVLLPAARALLVGLIVALPVAIAPVASAHALLEGSSPADGASYGQPPERLVLDFSENVSLGATSVQLVDGAGRSIDLERPRSADGASDARSLEIPLPALAPDRYLVRWHTISSDDLHPTEGSLVFGVGTEVTSSQDDATSVGDRLGTLAETILRWAALIGLGVAGMLLLMAGRLADRVPWDAGVLRRRAPRWALGGALAALLLGLLYIGRIAMFAGLLPALEAWPLTVKWAVAWLAGFTAWALIRGERRRERRRNRRVATGLLMVAIVAVTSVGHPFAEGWFGALLGAAHAVSTLAWACGAAVVAMVAVPALRAHDRARAVIVARAFTPIAVIAVPISVVTGLLLAGLLLPSVGALTSTDYGQALILKLGLLGVALACAAGTVMFLVTPRGRARLSYIVAIEGALLGLVVLAASWLGATHPASLIVWAPSPAIAPTTGVLSTIADDLVVTLDIGPARPGRNFVTVSALDTRRPAPAPVASVAVGVDAEPALTAVPQGNGAWVAAVNLPSEGPAHVVVSVLRPGMATEQARFTWVIGPPAGTRLGGEPLAPIARLLAIGVVIVTVLALIAISGRRRVRAKSRSSKQSTRVVHD